MMDYSKYPEKWAWLPYFKISEFSCRGSGKCLMDEKFMNALLDVRMELNRPMIITSGYRSPEHNASVSKTGVDGPHTSGKACDVLIYGKDAHRLIHIAMNFGFTGIGVSQSGPREKRFVHLDMLPENELRPWIWSY